MNTSVLEYNHDFIVSMIEEGNSAGIVADELAFKGIIVSASVVNKYLQDNNIVRKKIVRKKEHIKNIIGTGNFGGTMRGILQLKAKR